MTVLLRRPRLIQRITSPAQTRITLIAAPAGYGKSTLAVQWAEESGHALAWLALGPECNQPCRFLERLAGALPGDVADHLRHGGGALTLDLILDALRARPRLSRPLTIVLDDVHLLENSDVLEVVDALMAALPERTYLVLLSRTRPPLRLARLRAAGHVRELNAADLSFTLEETREIVAQSLPLTAEQADRLAARTEGWITGIRLALLALGQHAGDEPAAIDNLPMHHWLEDYVVEEVLAALPDDLRDFVLRTAFLPRLEPALCDHVLGITESAASIDEVRRRLVFVRPIDLSSGVIAYHALFAECAVRIADRQFSANDQRERRLRAADWFAGQEEWEAALEQAILAEAWDVAIRYARVVGNDLMNRDMSASRRYWLEKLPLEHLFTDDDLVRWYISSLFYTGHVQQANELLSCIRPRWEASEEPMLRGYLASCEAFQAVMDGDDGHTLRHLYTSLNAYPLTAHVERLHAWAGIMEQEIYRGNDTVANQAYRQAQACLQRLPSEQAWGLRVQEYRANHLALRGDLSSAIELYRRNLASTPAVHEYRAANSYARLAELHLERNDLNAAANATSKAEHILERTAPHAWHSEVMLTVARFQAALNDMEAAWSALRRARSIHQESGGGPLLKEKVDATEAWLWLMTGKVPLARAWAATFDPGQPWRTVYFGDLDPRIVWVRCAISGGELPAADAVLRSLIASASETGRWAEMVSLAMWQGVVSLELNDAAQAMDALRLALRHGRPGGLVRSFTPPGCDLAPFLSGAVPQLPAEDAAYVRTLLERTARPSARVPESARGPRPVPITRREHEVLLLLAAGLSNQEIGDRLFIAEHTAKKHVSNILRKLEAPNRTTAVSRALEFGLLGA